MNTLIVKTKSSRNVGENVLAIYSRINDASNYTRYERKKKVKELLKYIHGYEKADLFGSCNFYATSYYRHRKLNLCAEK